MKTFDIYLWINGNKARCSNHLGTPRRAQAIVDRYFRMRRALEVRGASVNGTVSGPEIIQYDH